MVLPANPHFASELHYQLGVSSRFAREAARSVVNGYRLQGLIVSLLALLLLAWLTVWRRRRERRLRRPDHRRWLLAGIVLGVLLNGVAAAPLWIVSWYASH